MAWFCFSLLVLGGCDDGAESPAESKPGPLVRTADCGAVKLMVRVPRDAIGIAERLELTIEVQAERGIEVQMPEFGESVGEFQVRDFREPGVEEMDGDLLSYKQIYGMDIFLSGECEIPPVTVRYRDKRSVNSNTDDGDVSEAALTAEGFTIKIASLLEGEFDPQNFRDVKPLATLKPDRTWAWAWWSGGILLSAVAAAALVLMLVRRGRRAAAKVVVPPHEWAMQQLHRLVDAKLIEQGKVQEFYYRLNEITRTYIELRFGLMAPERTTEEFMGDLRHTRALSSQHQSRLVAFLESCDLVKFARYEPGTEEIEGVFNAARDFVQETRPGEQTREGVAA